MNVSPRLRALSLALGCLLFTASIALAIDVDVRALNSVDISAFATCSWSEGRPAPDHQVEQEIRRSVEEQLGRAGYSIVPENGDCQLTSHAVGDANFPVGVLMIEIREVSTDRVAWRGEANGLVEGSSKQRMKLVRKIVKRMFKHFPESGAAS